MKRTISISILSCLTVALLTFAGLPSVLAQQKNIILATTTSTQDSGLLDVLLPDL